VVRATVAAGPIVVLIEDRGLTRADQLVLGHDHPGRRFQDDQCSVIDHDGDCGTNEAGGYRVAGRAVADARQAVDLAAA
jgi:hypothetical protein